MNFRATTLRWHTEPPWGPKVGLPTALIGGWTAGRKTCCPMKPRRVHVPCMGQVELGCVFACSLTLARVRYVCAFVLRDVRRRPCVGRLELGLGCPFPPPGALGALPTKETRAGPRSDQASSVILSPEGGTQVRLSLMRSATMQTCGQRVRKQREGFVANTQRSPPMRPAPEHRARVPLPLSAMARP